MSLFCCRFGFLAMPVNTSCAPPSVMLHYGILDYFALRYVMSRYVTLCYVTLRYVMLCHVTLCYVTLRYVMLCHVTYVMLCYVIVCYMLYSVVFSVSCPCQRKCHAPSLLKTFGERGWCFQEIS
jgi:hypothetical protein